jgi:hypothetical protein
MGNMLPATVSAPRHPYVKHWKGSTFGKRPMAGVAARAGIARLTQSPATMGWRSGWFWQAAGRRFRNARRENNGRTHRCRAATRRPALSPLEQKRRGSATGACLGEYSRDQKHQNGQAYPCGGTNIGPCRGWRRVASSHSRRQWSSNGRCGTGGRRGRKCCARVLATTPPSRPHSPASDYAICSRSHPIMSRL